MKRLWCCLGWLILAVAIYASSAAAEKWIYARTDNFEMYSAASESDSRDYLNELEQFREAFQQIFKLKSVGQPRSIVIMFKSDRQREPYSLQFKGKPVENAGFYLKRPDVGMIVLSAESQNARDSTSVIFHEYVHKLLHEQGIHLPVWLDEGLAVFYATMKVSKDSVEIGHLDRERLKYLARNNLMPLEKLFAITRSVDDYYRGDERQVFYAQSWLLLHYFMCGESGKLSGNPSKLLEVAGEYSGDLEVRFKAMFGMDFAQMERELRNYILAGTFRMRTLKLPIGDFQDKMQFRPVDDVERECMLENLRWRVVPDEANPLRMLELAEKNPQSPKPYEVLGAYKMQNNDSGLAFSFWEKAVERGSDNAYIHLQLAKEQLKYMTRDISLDYRAPPVASDPIRKYLDRAVELRPDYMEAWEALAQIEAFSEKPRNSVINKVQALLPLMRSKANTLIALTIVHWRQGDMVTTQNLLAGLKEYHGNRGAVKQFIGLLERRLQKDEAVRQRKAAAGSAAAEAVASPTTP